MVGLGPGDPGLLCPLARAALASASAVVGYSGYLDLLEPEVLEGREVVSTGMTGEVERAGRAVDLALAGRDVAVVSSGDAGIYAMAGLVLEVLEERGLLERVPCEVVPGVPALAAAAALLGAPLTHDFACVSLSDLLTPWEVIERRLDAAAGADFVLVLYNPRSKRRADHLERALAVIARAGHPGGCGLPGLSAGAARGDRPAGGRGLRRRGHADHRGGGRFLQSRGGGAHAHSPGLRREVRSRRRNAQGPAKTCQHAVKSVKDKMRKGSSGGRPAFAQWMEKWFRVVWQLESGDKEERGE